MKNEYRIDGEFVYILLKNRKGVELETVIDKNDFEKVRKLDLSWHLKWAKFTQSYYCKAGKYMGKVDGKYKYKTIHLHDVILPLQDKVNNVIHHKNHITLDNRKSNLEEVSRKKNCLDRRGANPNGTTGVRNVAYSKGKYIVQLFVNSKLLICGKFDNLEEAKKCAEHNRSIYYSNID